jgi:hypothetical protein
MIRTQVQLTEEQWRFLKALSHQRGVSIAELIRQSVDHLSRTQERGHISADEKRRRIMAVVGRYRSGQTDVSIHHDDYLAEDYLA